MNGTPIGFDRRLKLEWLDATAAALAERLSPDEVRVRLDGVLAGHVSGLSVHSARGKTKTVLMHIWALVPDRLWSLRDAGLDLLQDASPTERLALHWGMCVTTYPFFRAVAENVGRLIQLQGSVSLAELTTRVREAWGDRSTLDRAAQRILRSMVDWGVLGEGTRKGEFRDAESPPLVVGGRRGAWLLAAAALAARESTVPLAQLHRSLALFPFDVSATAEQIEAFGGLRVVRQGVDREVGVVQEFREKPPLRALG